MGGDQDIQSLDRELVRLQKSTRTTVPALLPLHDILRQKYRWYYNWHLWGASKYFHALFLIVFLFSIGTLFYQFLFAQPAKVLAATATLRPSGDVSVGWTPTGTDGTCTGTNCETVDEAVLDGSDNIETSTLNAEDIYDWGTTTATEITQLDVYFTYNGKATAAGPPFGEAEFNVNIGGWQTAQTLSCHTVNNNPAESHFTWTGTWTQAQLNALQTSIKRSNTGPVCRVHQIYVVATYTVAAAPTAVTVTPTPIAAQEMTWKGNITSDGGDALTDRGFKYKTGSACAPAPSSQSVPPNVTGTYSYNKTGLSVNTQYSYFAYATNGAGTGAGSCLTQYTLANTPASAPTVANPQLTSLDVTPNDTQPGNNPATTTYAFGIDQDNNGAVDAGGWVQAGGTLGASEIDQVLTTWGTKTVTGLASCTLYRFIVRAHNGDDVVTAYSASATGTTLCAGISIAGTASIASSCSGTVAVAVNGVKQGQTGSIIGTAPNCTWSIAGVTVASTNPVTVFIDGAAEAAESTAVAKYDGTGDMSGMVLNPNTVTIGSGDNQSLTATNVGHYVNGSDEDIMITWASSNLNVAQAYTDPTINILASNTLTIGAAETLTAHNVTVTGTLVGTTTANFSVAGDWDSSVGTFTAGTGSTVDLTGTGNLTGKANAYFYNLKAAHNTKTTTISGANHIYINNLLYLYNGGATVAVGTNQFRLYKSDGDPIVIDSDSPGPAIGTRIIYLPTANITVKGHHFDSYVYFYGVTNSSTITLDPTGSNFSTDLDVLLYAGTAGITQTLDTGTKNISCRNLTIGGGTTQYGVIDFGSGTHTITGNMARSGTAASNSIDFDTATVTVGGNVDFTGITVTAGAGTLVMNGASATITGNAQVLNNFTVDGTTINGSGSFSANGTFTINSGKTFSPAADSVISSVTGTLTGSGTAKVSKTGANAFLTQYTIANKTLTNLTIDYSSTTGAQGVSTITYGHLAFNNTGQTATLEAETTASGNLTITTGTLASGNFTINVAGNWTNTPGATGFTAGTGATAKVNLTGAGGSTQTLSGDTTFYNFSATDTGAARTIKFTDGSTTTVSGTWTATGASGKLITLTRSSTSSTWAIVPALDGAGPLAKATVSYVNVTHSDNNGAPFCATFSSHDEPDTNLDWHFSDHESCAPAEATGVTIENISQTGFRAAWADISDEDDYNVYVVAKPSGDCSGTDYGAKYATAAQNATSQDVIGKSVNTRYCVAVASHSSLFGDANKTHASAKYTKIEPITGVTWGDFTTTDLSATPSNPSAPTNLDAGGSGIQYTVRLASDDSLVEQSLKHNMDPFDPTASLGINTRYKFEIVSLNGDGWNGDEVAESALKYTRANPPSLMVRKPGATNTLAGLSTTQITWNWNLNSNPAGTKFCKQGTATCTDTGTELADDDPGRNANTQYTVNLEAVNGDNIESLTFDSESAYTAIEDPSLSTGVVTPNSIELNTNSLTNLTLATSGIEIEETTHNQGGGGETCFVESGWCQSTTINDTGPLKGSTGAEEPEVGTTYTYQINARNAEGVLTGVKGPFSFQTTPGIQLLFELPGETLDEDGDNHLTYSDPNPSTVTANVPFDIEVKAADTNAYRDLSHIDTINLSSTTDTTAVFPAAAAMAQGTISYSGVVFKKTGPNTIIGLGSGGSSHQFAVAPGPCSASVSTATAAPTSLDVEQTSTVTINLKDSAGNSLAGHTVSVSSNQGDDDIDIYAAATDGNGVITAGVSGHSAHTSTITVGDTTAGSICTLDDKPEITFNAVGVNNPTNVSANASVSACAGSPPSCTVRNELSWTNPASFDHINIYRSETSGVRGSQIGDTTGNSYTDNDVSPGVTYFYTLEAEDAIGNKSSGTAQVSARGVCNCGDPEGPTKPTNLRATAIECSSFSIAWDASRDDIGVAGYEIYNVDTGILVGTTTDLTFSFDNLSPDTTYRLHIRAYDAARNFSDFSNILSVKTLANCQPPKEAAFLILDNVPEKVDAGQHFEENVRLLAADAGGRIVTEYNKQVHFGSTDKKAELPSPYAFTGTDAGIHEFDGQDFTLNTVGNQKIIASDDSTETYKIVDVLGGFIFTDTADIIKDFAFKPEAGQVNTGMLTTLTALLLARPLLTTALTATTIIPYLLYWLLQFLQALGMRKKAKPWGVVFNSQTGQPISFAVVRIYEKQYNRMLQRSVSDREGRYGFLAKPGEYYIVASKSGYTFPPKQKVAGFYEKIYLGASFKIETKDQSIVFNIPLEPVTANALAINIWVWLVRINKFLQKLRIPLLVAGFLFALFMCISNYHIIYLLSLLLYLLIGVLEYLRTLKARPYGVVSDIFNHPLDMAMVRIYKKSNNQLVETDVTDSVGRFRFMVNPGIYYLTAAKPGYLDFKSHLMYLEKEKTLVSTTIKLKKVEK